jgi:CRP-like cAMP-binding protein
MNEVVWIIRRLKTDIFLPDDLIIRENEVGNEMYFIKEGVIKIIVENQDENGKKTKFNVFK